MLISPSLSILSSPLYFHVSNEQTIVVEEASLLRMPSRTLCFSSAAFFLSNHACRFGLALPAEPVEVPESGIIILRMSVRFR